MIRRIHCFLDDVDMVAMWLRAMKWAGEVNFREEERQEKKRDIKMGKGGEKEGRKQGGKGSRGKNA